MTTPDAPSEDASSPDGAPGSSAPPAEVLGDPGLAFSWIVKRCYGRRTKALSDDLGVSQQSLRNWRRPGAGVPQSRRDAVAALIRKRGHPLRLSNGITLDHITRPPRPESSTESEGVEAPRRPSSKTSEVPPPDDPPATDAQDIPAPPAEVLNDPGRAFSWVVAACCGENTRSLSDELDLTRQTLWLWRQPGAGVPRSRRGEIEAMIANPDHPLRLPEGMTIDHIMRAGRVKSDDVGGTRENTRLLDFLFAIANRPGKHPYGVFGSIAATHLQRGINPGVFFQWGFTMGGVPTTYAPAVRSAMIQYGLHHVLGMEAETFRRYFVDYLCAEPDKVRRKLLEDDDE